jgi:Spy/CpxP family protein refolding chaperone
MLIINGVLLFMIIDKKINKGPSKGQTFLTEQLSFSEVQKDQFFELDKVHRQKMRAMDVELNNLRELLFNSFDEQNISVETLTMKMGEIETEKNRELFSFFSEVRKLCTEDQKEKFDQIIQEVLKKRSPKPPRGNRRKPPKPIH